MRKKWIAGISIIILSVILLSTIRHPTFNEQPSTNRRATDMRITEKPNLLNGDTHLLSINSLSRDRKLKEHLNSHPSIEKIEHNEKAKSHYHKNQVTVKFKVHPGPDQMAIIERDIEGKLAKSLDSVCIFSSYRKSTAELLRYFRTSKNVVYAEPNYIFIPNEVNDVFYTQYQWNLPMIQTELGWNISRGSKKIKIAVVDTGVDLNHQDLSRRLLKGYNVLKNNDRPYDDNGHGTHVAGIIASDTNNKIGVAGITWFNQIIPVKVMDKKGTGTSFDIAKGIRWAADHGADVINLSLGNYQPSSVMKEAIDYAFGKNVVLVAASGNDNTDHPSYPASFPEVLSVGAVNAVGERAPFSNYGSTVDVVAPGVQIPSTYPGQRYAALSGTSMAAPHVTALAGLVRSIYPGLQNTEVMNIIKRSTVDLGQPGPDLYYGNGLIDINSALKKTYKQRHPLGGLAEWWKQIR
ncbi:S8 family peptidase [Fictibacillus gelatini]|uniref:S8 family peptidase n=1 Tax=Fictibacillus gelatini TaxID=225985 RepID=UPI0004286C9B|nr:S8 family peptidase [Fictibacillus gelatini]